MTIFECPHCGLVLKETALVRPIVVATGKTSSVACPNCYSTVPTAGATA